MSSRRNNNQARRDLPNGGVSNNLPSDCMISELPIPILQDIFFRLPIKFVTLCKCVCNEWRNIISEPDFSECYIKSSNFKLLLHDKCYVYNSWNRKFSMLEISEEGNDCIRKTVDIRIPDLPENLQTQFKFVGLRNGCLCFKIAKTGVCFLYVHNLITGECIQLPGHHFMPEWYPPHYYFGFNPSGNKFKVLAARAYPINEADILTVGIDDNWRRLPTFSSSHEIVVCNGAFNWIPQDRGSPRFISTLEISEEKSGQFLVPAGVNVNGCALGTYKNHLCLIDQARKFSFNIWFMKEYAVAESWTEIIIESIYLPRPLESYYGFNPVSVLPDGGILFANAHENHLIAFNVEKRKCSRIDIYESAASEGDSNLFRPAMELKRW